MATIAALGSGLWWLPKGEFNTLAGRFMVFVLCVPLLIVSVVSTVIARALFCGSRRGVKAALFFDAFVASLTLFLLIAARPMDRPGIATVAAPFVILSGIEAAWLIAICRCSLRRGDSVAA